MPGSEMLLVEKTRIRGSVLDCAVRAAACSMLLQLLDVELVGAGVLYRAQKLVAQLLSPGRQVLLRTTVGGQDFHDAAHGDVGDALLRRQDGARAGGAARVHHFVRFDV